LQGLDYERSKEHRLVIGTEQAKAEALSGVTPAVRGDAAGAAPAVPGDPTGAPTTILLVRVLDTNDMAPEFTRLPPGQRRKFRRI
jgi:hypothetical protein